MFGFRVVLGLYLGLLYCRFRVSLGLLWCFFRFVLRFVEVAGGLIFGGFRASLGFSLSLSIGLVLGIFRVSFRFVL